MVWVGLGVGCLSAALQRRQQQHSAPCYISCPANPLPPATPSIPSHKRALCVGSLGEMGFSHDVASAAADASGCDVSAAAALLMEGGLCMGVKPVSVTGWVPAPCFAC